MNLKRRLAAGALAVAFLSGAGVANAQPAQAVTVKTYSISYPTRTGCSDALNKAMRTKRVMGFRVFDVHGCTQGKGGYWNAYFRYSW